MVRIESHLTKEESESIKKIAEQNGRSRKKQCEFYLRKMIQEENKG